MVEKKYNAKTKEREEHQEFINLDESINFDESTGGGASGVHQP